METNAQNPTTVPVVRTMPRIAWAAILFVTIAALAIYAHVRVSARADDYTGTLAIFDRVFDLLLAGFILAVAFATGRLVAARVGLAFHNLAEEFAFSVAIGAGVIGTGLLGLGLAGLLKPVPASALFVLLSIASATRLVDFIRAAAASMKTLRLSKVQWAGVVLFGLFIAILILRAATPPHSYDEAIYHLSVAKRFATAGRVYPVYDNWAGNMPFLVQMIYAVCLEFKSDIAAKLFSLGLTFTCAAALYGFCARLLNLKTGMVAAIGFFGAGMVVEVGITTRTDVTLACMIFLATYAMIVHLTTKETKWLWVSAVLSGFALGVKYTAVVWLALMGVMFLSERLWSLRDRLMVVVRHGALFGLIALAIASPWLIKNLVWFHNPLYPFGTGEVAEVFPNGVRYFNADDEQRLEAHFETARDKIPGRVNAIEQMLAESATHREERRPFRIWEYFVDPDRYNMAEAFHDPNNLFLVAPFALVFGKRRWKFWLLVMSAGFFVVVVRTSWVGRILLPVYPAMTVLAAAAITGFADWARTRTRFAALMPALVLLVALAPVAAANITQMKEGRDTEFLSGSISRREYMQGASYFPSIDFINRELPADARVLMIGAQMSYDLQRDYVGDVNWDTIEWQRLLARNDSLDSLNAELKERHITHVLFTPSLFTFSALIGRKGLPDVSAMPQPPGPDYAPQLRTLATFDLYKASFLEEIYRDNLGYHVYRIR